MTSVVIASPPVVEFTLTDAQGNPVVGLEKITSKNKTTATVASYPNVSFALAKLVPRTDQQQSEWVSYIVTTVPLDNQTGTPSCPNKQVCATRPTTDNTGKLEAAGQPGAYKYTFYRDVPGIKAIVDGLTYSGNNRKEDLGDLTYAPTLPHRLTIQISGAAPGTGTNTPDAVQTTAAVNIADPLNVVYDAEGIIEATDQGARAISCSWGQPVPADADGDPINQIGWDLVNAIQYAIDQGVAVINAAGNASEYYPDKNTYGVAEIIMWPAEIDGVTLVSSAGGPSPHTVDCPYNEPGTSSGPAYGYGIDFAVPAADVFTVLGPGYLAPAYANTWPNYGYGAWWDGLIIANEVRMAAVQVYRIITPHPLPPRRSPGFSA